MSQIESKVNSCIQYVLNSALFHWYNNEYTNKVRKFLSQAIKEQNTKKKITLLVKASEKIMEMHLKANDPNLIQISEQFICLGNKLENNSSLSVSSFTNKFPFGCED